MGMHDHSRTQVVALGPKGWARCMYSKRQHQPSPLHVHERFSAYDSLHRFTTAKCRLFNVDAALKSLHLLINLAPAHALLASTPIHDHPAD